MVVSGSAVQLACIISSGDLGISFSWSDPAGAAVSPSPINDTSSVISITPMMSSQYGTYTCMASNRFGNGNDTVIITEAGTKECHCIVYYYRISLFGVISNASLQELLLIDLIFDGPTKIKV